MLCIIISIYFRHTVDVTNNSWPYLLRLVRKTVIFYTKLHSLRNHHQIRKHQLLELSTLISAFQNDGPYEQEMEKVETGKWGNPTGTLSSHMYP